MTTASVTSLRAVEKDLKDNLKMGDLLEGKTYDRNGKIID